MSFASKEVYRFLSYSYVHIYIHTCDFYVIQLYYGLFFRILDLFYVWLYIQF